MRHTVLLLAVGVAGCAGASEAMKSENWFPKPASHLFETPSFMAPASANLRATRAITPDDLVDASGGCAAAASAAVAPAEGAAPDAAASPTVVGGVALGMTECEVVQRAGRPERIEIGGDAGARTAVLTYPSGERAGIYRFAGGRLQSMDRVADAKPAKPAPKPKKKPANRPA